MPSTSAATSAPETGCTLQVQLILILPLLYALQLITTFEQIKKKAKLNDSAKIASNELKEAVSKKDEKENCDVKDGSNGK